jgi:hypothetical protein
MKCQGVHNNPSRAKKSKKQIIRAPASENDDINMTIVHRESHPTIVSFQTFMN